MRRASTIIPATPASNRHDAAFQGYGRVQVDGAGRYAFRTIRPVAYPGRTPHIHFKVHAPGDRPADHADVRRGRAPERQLTACSTASATARPARASSSPRGRPATSSRARSRARSTSCSPSDRAPATLSPAHHGCVILLKSRAVRDYLASRGDANAASSPPIPGAVRPIEHRFAVTNRGTIDSLG